MASPFSLDQLQAFVWVLEAGSFSAAALRLDISQPAVSLQVRELERKLGTRLIERVGRKVGPTPAGVSLLGHAHDILDAVAQAMQAVSLHAEGVKGMVRLGTGATACLHFLPPLLRQLRKDYPSLQVLVTTGNTEEFVRRVEQNAVDFALVTLPVSSRALDVSPVLRDTFVAIGPGHATDLPKIASPQALGRLPLVLTEPAANTRQLVDSWLLAAGMRVKPEMELGNVEAIKEMVSAGLGYSIVPAMALRASERETLQVRPLRPVLVRELGLIARHDKPFTRAMRVVADAILDAGPTPRRVI